MALIRSDGFDLYDSTTEWMQAGWTSSDTAQTVLNTTEGRYGGGCIKGASSAHFAYVPAYCPGGSTIYVCFAYKHDGGVAGTTDMLSFYTNEGTLIGRIRYTDAGVLSAENAAGATSTAGGNPVPSNTWVFVEVKFTVGTDNSTGEISVHVGGSSVITFTATDTFATANDVLTTLRFGGNNGNWWVDDFILMDTSGSTMNGFLGDTRIDKLTVTGDGGTLQWTRNTGSNDYQAVDDVPSNEATDYVASSTAGQKSIFAISDMTVEPDDIWAVVVRAKMQKSNAGDRTWRALVKRGASEASGVTQGLQTDWVWQGMEGAVFYVDPQTTTQWDATGVNALQAGLEVVS